VLEEVQGCAAKTAISAISPKIGEIAVSAKIYLRPALQEVQGCPAKLRFFQKLRKIGEIAVCAKIS